MLTLQWRHNECEGVSNHQHLNCLLSHLFRRRSKKTSKLPVTGLCEANPSVTSQRASNMENVSIRWCHQAWEARQMTGMNNNFTRGDIAWKSHTLKLNGNSAAVTILYLSDKCQALSTLLNIYLTQLSDICKIWLTCQANKYFCKHC